MAKMTSKIDEAARLAAAIFAFQGWTYYTRGIQHTPDREELAETVRYLLRNVKDSKAETGRIVIQWDEDFHCYRVMLVLANLSTHDVYEEEGIDIMPRGVDRKGTNLLS